MRCVSGNILDVTEGVIVHQVNCRGRIGAGVSGAIISEYPQVKKDYDYICKYNKAEDLLGSWRCIEINSDLTIVNAYTQLNYGNSNKTNIVYTNMERLIFVLHQICEKYKDEEVYVPYKIGCGLAGGNWEEVEKGTSDIENLTAVRFI